MKKFAKVFLSCAAIAAVTGAVATSAMAADLTNVAYDSATGTVSFTAADAGTSQTLLVMKGKDITAVTTDIVKQIDQQDDTTGITSAYVGDLEDGVYSVWVGGNTATEVYKGTFTVGSTTAKTIVVGDTNGDGELEAKDATAILRKKGNKSTLIYDAGKEYKNAEDGTKVVVGDTNGDGELEAKDATAILRKKGNKSTLIYDAGKEISVVEEASAE
jgi:hypothetical protein